MLPIALSKARTHNLKDVDLTVHPGELVVVAGPSGAGKSSLAMDTLYAEGQRRFVESFSPYARQFLERLDRPPMDSLDPIAAGIAVDRRAPIRSSRSNVATMADLEPYLSALYACEAVPRCEACGVDAVRMDPVTSADRLIEAHSSERVLVSYPLRLDSVELYLDARERLGKLGYGRVKIGDEVRDLETLAPSAVFEEGRGTLGVVTDRVKIGKSERNRLAEAIEAAWRESRVAEVFLTDQKKTLSFASGLSCPSCGKGFRATSPALFSYQSPLGACGECRGFGRTVGIDWSKVIPNHELSLAQKAIRAWSGKTSQYERRTLKKFCDKRGISMTAPWRTLTEAERTAVIEGEGTWSGGKYPGVKKWFEWLLTKTYKMHVRVLLSRYRSYDPCAVCNGKRLSAESLQYRVAGLDLGQFHALEVREAAVRLAAMPLATKEGAIAARELGSRLSYLAEVGLGYLTLERQARTLSGGEAQRVSLTAALGSALTGALFVLDEPTVGLHASDVEPLVRASRTLALRGNAVMVIEHDPAFLRAADRIIELGPGAGQDGGRILFDGPPQVVLADKTSSSSRAVRAVRAPSTDVKFESRGRKLSIKNARGHNLEGLSVDIPLDSFVLVTGASGSGKSSLVDHVLYRTVARHLGEKDIEAALDIDALDGLSLLTGVVLVDQSPLGRTSRGNAATYTGAWDRVRAIFGKDPEAERLGLGPGHFSFNVAGGRCDACAGEGSETVEMQFLADVKLVCPQCGGKRFSPEVLAFRYQGKNVSDLLDMTVKDALVFFAADRAIVRALGPLEKLGLSYLRLGQPLSTLSGGEAQRLKLARALTETKKGRLFVFDEPSAGLHADEVKHVIDAIGSLVQGGGSAVVVDHDLALVSAADWVIELGPGGGKDGGKIVFEGTPVDLSRGTSKTADSLRAATREIGKTKPVPRAEPHPPVIRVEGAREHNLKNLSVDIPHGKVTVVTGPSGSGKSTLTFDVVFAEGQRRFLETLTPYARQFLPTMQKPDVERVLGVPPPIALEQRTTRTGANSTVATVTEIAHYLRLLYAKASDPTCPKCDLAIETRSAVDAYADVVGVAGTITLLAPAVEARKGLYTDLFVLAARKGIAEAIVDGVRRTIEPPPKLKKSEEHTIEFVVFEGAAKTLTRERFDVALSLGKGALKVQAKKGLPRRIATARVCPSCGDAIPELDPRWFSFNTKQGQCGVCEGTGREDADDPHSEPCEACEGSRLSPIPRAQRLAGLRYHELTKMSLDRAADWVGALVFTGDRRKVAEAPQAELTRRLRFATDVGLSYLSLDRPAGSLSGGEMQRLRLAAQLGSGLTGALYVLDEPTIGLHPRDTKLLLRNLRRLADGGSTVLVVEHDVDTIRAADHLIDLGPTGGLGGGRLMAAGSAADVLRDPSSPTAKALVDEREAIRARRLSPKVQAPATEFIEVFGARENNLKIDRATFPVGKLTVVCGVSGSGKSTLVTRILGPAVRKALKLAHDRPGLHDKLTVPKSVVRALFVDQSPIGRTPRSVPATYLGIYDLIRKVYAGSREAKQRGRGPAFFSFNTTTGGRCQACAGQGSVSHEMSFLPDVVTPCLVCAGKRFDAPTLEIKWSGLSIGDVLDLSAEEACGVFAAHSKIKRPLELMTELGIGYLKLGQGSHTLSGGEAQRLKLATELATASRTGNTLYMLDEPTTGLHTSDVAKLSGVLDRLAARGDTVVVIEHHPTVIASADWVIELGPDGGDAGGQIVAACTPEELRKKATATGKVLVGR